MEKEFNYKNIEDYINGIMKGEEKKAFEAEMSADEDLAKEVAFYQEIADVSEVVGDEKLISTIKDIDVELDSEGFYNQEHSGSIVDQPNKQIKDKEEKKIRQIDVRKLLLMAASIMLLVTAGLWWVNANYSNVALAQQYFNDKVIQSISRSTTGNAKDIFKPGLEALNAANYPEAINFFEKIPESDDSYTEARLYLAIAQYKIYDFQNAIENARLIVEKNSRFSEKAKWLQLNAMLKSGQTDIEFAQLLNDMADNSPDNYYRTEAGKLKRDLDRFWRKFVF